AQSRPGSPMTTEKADQLGVLVESVLVDADPTEVYEYFTSAKSMATWMGHRASLDPRPGGEFAVDVNDSEIRGRYVELDPPRRIVFTWGFVGSSELPPGASTVEVTFTRESEGTLVEVVHSGLPVSERERHAHGWAHFLPRLCHCS